MTQRTLDKFLQAAIDEARKGLAEGGIPIGSVLVIDGRIVGRGHNRRVQKGSVILHAEMDAIENAGRLKARDYRRAVLYSTLSPCAMCSGMALLYRIPRIVIGENRTFRGPEGYLRSRGVTVEIVDDTVLLDLCALFQNFFCGTLYTKKEVGAGSINSPQHLCLGIERDFRFSWM